MDKQPNEAQIKELYTIILDGKVEFGTVVDGEIVCYRQTTWNKEDEEWNIEVVPRIDSLEYLGWLFKYAVPICTCKAGMVELSYSASGYRGDIECVAAIGRGRIRVSSNDPALALFWAMWEVYTQ